MLDPLEVIGPIAARLETLTRALEAATPAGHAPDPNSPAYKALAAAIEEGTRAVRAADAQLTEEMRAELGALSAGVEAKAAEHAAELNRRMAGPTVPAVEPPEGGVTYPFEDANAPTPDEMAAILRALVRRAEGRG